jgi:hypothetical protein
MVLILQRRCSVLCCFLAVVWSMKADPNKAVEEICGGESHGGSQSLVEDSHTTASPLCLRNFNADVRLC